MAAAKEFSYKYGECLTLEEDMLHEFKGHKDIAAEDVTARCREYHTRQSVSRTLCAFLNTGQGGTVYLGVLNDASVQGLPLTEFQKDHILRSLESLFTRYYPPVLQHVYTVRFVPVTPANSSVVIKDEDEMKDPLYSQKKQRPHMVASQKRCWCENEAVARTEAMLVVPLYIIEIEIFPWDKDDPRNKHLIKTKIGLHPMYENEEELCYVRRQGSNMRCTYEDVIEITKQEVKAYYSKLGKAPLKHSENP